MASSQGKTEPTSEDYVAPDANCCITSVVNFEKLSDYFASYVNSFFEDCYNKDIPIVYFEFIEEEALKNVASGIRDIIEKRFPDSKDKRTYLSKYSHRAEEKLKEKFEKWEKLDSPADCKLDNLVGLFKKHEKEILTEGGREKENIPDRNDIRLIKYLDECCCEEGFILSQDFHFKEYEQEIENVFPHDIVILPLEDLTQIRIGWNWA